MTGLASDLGGATVGSATLDGIPPPIVRVTMIIANDMLQTNAPTVGMVSETDTLLGPRRNAVWRIKS